MSEPTDRQTRAVFLIFLLVIIKERVSNIFTQNFKETVQTTGHRAAGAGRGEAPAEHRKNKSSHRSVYRKARGYKDAIGMSPMTPMAAPRATRSTRSQAAETDKENMPPPATENAVPITPVGKGAVSYTPVGKGTSSFSVTTPGATPVLSLSTPNHDARRGAEATPGGQTGAAPKTLDEWSELLTSLPTATATDCARLERLYERALGSGGGNEELDVGENKDKEKYVALWLRRIMLDPDEGTSYLKFMAKWHIGRKLAAVYVLRAMLCSQDKTMKSLQEGIDASAQPIALLQDLLARVSAGERVKKVCEDLLPQHPTVEAILGASGPAPATPTPTTRPHSANSLGASSTAVGTRRSAANEEKEDTVCFGPKTSVVGVAGTQPSGAGGAAMGETVSMGEELSAMASKNDTVTLGGKLVAAENAARAVAKSRALRVPKRSGLSGGPARRVTPEEAKRQAVVPNSCLVRRRTLQLLSARRV